MSATAAAATSTFSRLFRSSKFVKIGAFDGSVLVGKIVHRAADDLYIDFGFKFDAVCKRPQKDGERLIF